MTDENYVAELRGHGMLSTNQAADRIEELTAERDRLRVSNMQMLGDIAVALGRIEALTAERDEARKKFDDTDLCWNGFAPCGWSLTLIDKADTAEAERDRLRKALKPILRFVPQSIVECRGDKCREPWCASCYGEDAAITALDRASAEAAAARAALKGETP